MRNLLFIWLFVGFNTLNAQTSFYNQLSKCAIELTYNRVIYDASYFSIPYPNGDVPPNKGVCSDVVIRAYRKMGIDLQKEVHEDMVANFHKYPKKWGLSKTDRNIDHRRVPNLMVFFERHGTSLDISNDASSYMPGDIVAWDLGGGLTHIGIVVILNEQNNGKPLIVHNIGHGQEISDCLFQWKIIGHYRYNKKK